MSGQFERLIYTGAGVGVALAIEHFLCYDPEQFKREGEAVLFGSNVLGVATIAAGYGIAKKDMTAAMEVATIAAVAASFVAILRIARRAQRVDRAVNLLAGRIFERIEEALDNAEGHSRNGFLR